MHFEHDILAETTFYGLTTSNPEQDDKVCSQKHPGGVRGGRWEIRVLMEQTLSLHYVAEIPLSLRYTPLKRSFLLTPLRSGFVPLAPVGRAMD